MQTDFTHVCKNNESTEVCKKKLKRTLDIIMDANSVNQNKCDDILLGYDFLKNDCEFLVTWRV